MPPITPKASKIRALLREKGIHGVIATSPENCHYLTGIAGNQCSVSRLPGYSFALASADDSTPAIAITMDYEYPSFHERIQKGVEARSYDTWVGVRTWDSMHGSPAPSDLRDKLSALDAVLNAATDLAFADGVIGLELDTLPHNYFLALQTKFPKATFVNVSDIFLFARSVKDADEIARFRQLCTIADNAFLAMSSIVAPGVSEKEMAQCFRKEVIASGICAPSPWNMFACGVATAALCPPGERRIAENDLIKFDAGVYGEFDFYTTDTSRGWILGSVDPLLVKLKDRLYEAQRKMLDVAKPGLPINELFRTGYEWVKAAFPSYVRGHMGHNISLGPQTAEAPLISASETRPLEAGMVLAVEAPCYIEGVGGFNIEDMVLITPTGAEVLTPLTPHYL